MNEDRRESRIPRCTANTTSSMLPPAPKPLAERSNTSQDRKRKAAAVEEAPEAKRITRGRPPLSSGPAHSSDTTSVGSSVDKSAAGADESFEELQARTGITVNEVLNKKLLFKKQTMPAQKLEQITPLLKELRSVGWHLLAQKHRADMDGQQWKKTCESLELALATEKEAWSKKQDEIETQVQEIQVLLMAAEENNSRLQEAIDKGEAIISTQQSTIAVLNQQIDKLKYEIEQNQAQLEGRDSKIKELEEVVRQTHKYSTTLQTYNTNLQTDVNQERAKREEIQKVKDHLQSQVAELGGMVKSLEQVLHFEKEQVGKLRSEREAASADVAVLRNDLDSSRLDRERLQADVVRLTTEVDRYKAAGGKSLETLEELNHDKAALSTQLDTQRKLMDHMRQDLAMAREQKALSESLCDSRGRQLEEYKVQLQQLQESLADAERRVYEGELIRRKLHNTIQELKGNIRVFCRVRPITSQEIGESTEDNAIAVEFPNSGDLLGRGLGLVVPPNTTGTAAQKHHFAFDKVFGPSTKQEQVFEEISELVQSALDGHKVCIFAYGQTGSGKTFTMLGNHENPGMIPRAMHQVFDCSKKLEVQGWSFAMQASMLEIYNEDYKDLLAKKKSAEGKKHNVVHDANGVTNVSDLTLVDVSKPDRVDELLKEAMDKRSVGFTQLNEQSSRSHMVFTLRIDGYNASTEVKVQGVLNLIDLAGSERVKESGATGQRLKEAQAINKSLAALGDVIMALANKNDHIPFRNSKLTWLLQPCLGGDAKTLMFVNVAPSKEFAQESLCSLRFAAKVNACEINPRRSVKAG